MPRISFFNEKENQPSKIDFEKSVYALVDLIKQDATDNKSRAEMIKRSLLLYFRSIMDENFTFDLSKKKILFQQIDLLVGKQEDTASIDLLPQAFVVDKKSKAFEDRIRAFEEKIKPLLSKRIIQAMADSFEQPVIAKKQIPDSIRTDTASAWNTSVVSEKEEMSNKIIGILKMFDTFPEEKKQIKLVQGQLDLIQMFDASTIDDFSFLRSFRLDSLKDKNGNPLIFGCLSVISPKAFKAFLDAGVDVNLRNQFGESLLMELVEKNRQPLIEMVLLKGADVNVKVNGGTALSLSCDRNTQPNTMQKLVTFAEKLNLNQAFGPLKKTPLMLCAEKGTETKVKFLINRHVDLDAQDKQGNTALMLALIEEQNTCAELLVNAKCNLNLMNKKGETALDLAIKINNIYLVREMLDKDVKINNPDFLRNFLKRQSQNDPDIIHSMKILDAQHPQIADSPPRSYKR